MVDRIVSRLKDIMFLTTPLTPRNQHGYFLQFKIFNLEPKAGELAELPRRKGTVSAISSDFPCKNCNAQFTAIPFRL